MPLVNESGRVEAFSDGVFAIAITLLVLEIKVPEDAKDNLWSTLGGQWPSYAAYVVTFLVIGIMCVIPRSYSLRHDHQGELQEAPRRLRR
jgi:uncharacterized membrane protein